MKNPSFLKSFFVLICLFSLLTSNSLSGQPWRSKEREITRLIDKNKDCEENMKAYYNKNKALVNKIKALEVEVQRYKQDQAAPSIVETLPEDDSGGGATPGGRRPRSPDESSPPSNSGNGGASDYKSKFEDMKSRLGENERTVERLNADLRRANQKIGRLEGENERLRSDIEALGKTIEALEAEIARLTRELDRAMEELDALAAVVACVNGFQSGRADKRRAAREEIVGANQAYERYRQEYSRNNRADGKTYEEGQMLLEEAWQTYSKYGAANCDSVICRNPLTGNTLLLSYCDDYLEGYENYLIARITAFEPHIIANSMPEGMSLSAKLNKLNEVLLSRIGQALSKGVYNDKSDTQKLVDELEDIMERIPNLIVQERKESENTEIKGHIQDITKAYNKANYAVAISIYNQYERLFKIEEFNEESYRQDILSAKYCAGTILLWDLGEVSRNQGLVNYNSWLGARLGNRTQFGRQLLSELISDLESSGEPLSGWEESLLKRAYISSKKINL